MRKRTNMNGLVSHTTPSGASYQSGKNKCEMGIKRLERLIDAGYKMSGATKVKHEEPEFKIVMVFGKPVKLTVQEYKDHWTFDIQK